jgi:cytosine/adenosine deaminase-related metal-dependent hydrolase
MTSIYTARWVLPIISAAINDGVVAIEGTKIVAVGKASEIIPRFPGAGIQNFGASVILPGLINAHSHLELTVMRGFLEGEEQDFFAWLRKLTIARLAMTPDDLFVSATCGAIEAVRAGITCVGDSSSFAAQSMKALREIGLRGTVYQESFGPDAKLAHDNVAKLRDQLAALRVLESEIVRAGVSPHAPYTVSAPQLELISRLAIDEKLPLMMHAAESASEQSFMMEGTGAFADNLRSRSIEWKAPGISTIQYLSRLGVLDTKPLLAHCITVDDEDIAVIKSSGAGIAHCPKSNAKLGHGRAPFAKFIAAGVRVGLGSDSVASNNNCDLIEEARFATLLGRVSEARPSGRAALAHDAIADARASDTVSADQALFAATLGGARVLDLDNRIGALAAGMQADLIAVGLEGVHQRPVSNAADTLIFSSSGSDVRLTMIAGKEIYRDGELLVADQHEVLQKLHTVRTKIESAG